MGLLVQKFGGTSVGTPERILSVAERIRRVTESGHQLVVVVSAMGHTTDELIELAHRVSKQPPNREMDMLLTAGERISMALLSMALADRKIPAVSFTGSQSGIITDGSHRRARIKHILGDRVRQALQQGKVAIVAGFQGVSETKEVTTLGRGGSDTSAVALAAALGADACEIYTDVDGVYSADPRIVNQAKLWKRIPYDLMTEMAVRGAGVLHPRSVELSSQAKVPLWVKNSHNENGGTQVIAYDSKQGMEEFKITGVVADPTRILVTIEMTRPTVVIALWENASRENLSVVAPVFASGRVQFFAEQDAEGEWRKLLEKLAVDGFVREYQIESNTIPLSVVGYRFSQDGRAISQVLETLARHHVPSTVGSSSALAMTLAIPRTHADDAVRALHEELF